MSNSRIFVQGVKTGHENWHKMKAVFDSCIAAGVSLPEEVRTFFGERTGDEAGPIVDLTGSAVRSFNFGKEEIVEVDLAKIPPDIAIIRMVHPCTN